MAGVLCEKRPGGAYGGRLSSIELGGEIEPPSARLRGNTGLRTVVEADPRGSKDAAVEVAAGLRSMSIDDALATNHHRTPSVLVIAQEHSAVMQPRSREEERARNVLQGRVFVSSYVDEVRRSTARRAITALHVRAAASVFQDAQRSVKPLGERPGRKLQGLAGGLSIWAARGRIDPTVLHSPAATRSMRAQSGQGARAIRWEPSHARVQDFRRSVACRAG